MLIEVCSTSLQSVKNAASAGADRIELCSALELGGLTPSMGLIKKAQELNIIDIHCLLRPRVGHFIYTDEELNLIEEDLKFVGELGCKGVVLGALTPEFKLDLKRLERWRQLAGDMYLTFHRAFDVIVNPKEALQQLIELGYDCILTAGGSEKAIDGFNSLEEWNKKFGEQILIMPGSGINTNNCQKFKSAGFKALHLSGSESLNSLIPPDSVNTAISFLNQPIYESSYSTIKEVVDRVKA